jgi:LacI family transcriptional regulator
MNKKVSLKDIAKKVGVSTATVSYALSKDKENKISAAVVEKVKKVAKELNYQPNQIAKSLKSGRTFTIGLIVADISNPFFAQIARIIEDEAAKLGYTVIFGSSDEKSKKSWDLIQLLLNRQVDGFILAPTEGSEAQVQHLKDVKIPFVLIDRYFPQLATNYVVIDNYNAAFGAVERLVKTGNKKIGIIAYSSKLQHMKERIKGYREAMEKNNIEIKTNWVKQIDFFNIKRGIRIAIDELLSDDYPVNAIFFTTNTLAISGLKYLDELNYRVPHNLAIVSFDEGEAFDFYYCPLTHVKQPLQEIGRTAVKILTEQIIDPSLVERKIFLNAKLIIRKSCNRN